MDNIESQIKTLLAGEGLKNDQIFCDFTLADQNEALASKGITPTGPTDYTPITKKSVTYIVGAVLINEEGEVLMMQEAKPTCKGQWYLPAGRMEPGETITDAVKREVLEETGLEMDPTTLILIESAAGSWFRFVMTGVVVGGKLKTPADADSESIQAKWVRNINELQLRAKDIIPVIEKGLEYHTKRDEPWHSKNLPAIVDHKKLYMRLVICVRRRLNNRVCVLASEKNHVHLPLCEIHPQKSIHNTLKKYMNEIFGAELPPHRPVGVLSMEYNGKPAGQHDGVCINILIGVRCALEEILLIDKYTWKELNSALGEELIKRHGKNLTIPLNVIR